MVWFSNRTAEKLADLVKVEMVWNYWAPTRLQARSWWSVALVGDIVWVLVRVEALQCKECSRASRRNNYLSGDILTMAAACRLPRALVPCRRGCRKGTVRQSCKIAEGPWPGPVTGAGFTRYPQIHTAHTRNHKEPLTTLLQMSFQHCILRNFNIMPNSKRNA